MKKDVKNSKLSNNTRTAISEHVRFAFAVSGIFDDFWTSARSRPLSRKDTRRRRLIEIIEIELPVATHTNRNRNVIASPRDKFTYRGAVRGRIAVPALTVLRTLAYGSVSTPLPRSALVSFYFPFPHHQAMAWLCYGSDSQLAYCEPKHNRALHVTFGFKMIELVPPSRQPAVGSRKRGVSPSSSRVDVLGVPLMLRVTSGERLFDAKGKGEAITICS